jgi:hypothetical protein
MSETLQEFCDSRGVTMRVDRQAGVLRGVKILGLKSRNGRSYLPDTLRQAAALYENAKVNVNHPKGHPAAPRDYQDRLGQIRGVELRADEGLFGDLHFNPKHALAEQLVWDAEHAPENVGFSHNVEARTARRGEEVVVEAITRVQSVDLVADPATTRGLFESLDVGQVSNLPAGVSSPVPLFETLEDVNRRQNAEIERLKAENSHLSRELSQSRIRESIRRLLKEHGLPELESDDPADRAILGEKFLETLTGVADESLLRPMIAERAALVETLREKNREPSGGPNKPVSRDQHSALKTSPTTAKAFVEAIT